MRTQRHATRLLLASLAACCLAACGSEPQPIGAGPITPADLAERIRSGDAPFILDVRTPGEFSKGHIPGAVNITHAELAARQSELPTDLDLEIVVHCERGGRAKAADAVLVEAGYTNVRDLSGHMSAWRSHQLPVE